MKVIYNQKYTHDLGIEDNKDRDHYGWLCYRHPDGQWVTLVDMKQVIKEMGLEAQS